MLDNQRDPVISRSLDELLAEAEFVIEPVTEIHARLARQAYADFGKGSGHHSGLNFGDCLSYALALDTREPLLWKGDDFGHTGLRPRWTVSDPGERTGDGIKVVSCPAWMRLGVPAKSRPKRCAGRLLPRGVPCRRWHCRPLTSTSTAVRIKTT